MATTTSLPPDVEKAKGLYAIVLIVLGVALLGGIAAWIGLTFQDKEMPEGLASIVSLIAGGLLGVLAPQPNQQ